MLNNCMCGHHVDDGGHEYPGGACTTPGCFCQYVEYDAPEPGPDDHLIEGEAEYHDMPRHWTHW